MRQCLLISLSLCFLLTSGVQAYIIELRKSGTDRSTFDASTSQPLEIEIFVDTEGEMLGGISVYLSFDDTYFELLDAEPERKGLQPVETGPFITWQTLENDTHGDPGNSILGFQIDYSKMTLSSEGAVMGQGVVGIIHLLPIKPVVSTEITFDDNGFFNRETQGNGVDGDRFFPIRFRELRTATISVQGGPQFDRPLPDVNLLLGETREIPLNDYVTDVNTPDAALNWTTPTSEHLDIQFDPATHVLRIQTKDEWTGEETLEFEVSDLEGNRVTGTMHVRVSGAPTLQPFPDVLLRIGGAFERISLDDYVDDPDTPPDQMGWDIQDNPHVETNINAQRVLTLQPAGDWFGEETLTITATDPDGNEAQGEIQVRILPDKTNPIVSELPDVIAAADGSLSLPPILDLDEYVYDPDDAPETLNWHAEGMEQVQAEIDPDTHEVTFRSDGWTGSETVTFTVVDPQGEKGEGDCTVTLVPEHMPPILAPFPEIRLIVHAPGEVIDLDDYVFDLNHTPDQMEWHYAGQELVELKLGPQRILTLSTDQPTQETITFTVMDPDGNEATGELRVTAEGLQPPVISALPKTVLRAGEAKTAFDLDDYVSDDFTAPEALDWKASRVDAAHLVLSIAADHTVLAVAGTEWHGEETITFTATDSDGNETSQTALFRVSAAPSLKLPAVYEILAGTTDTSLKLAEYVTDPDTPADQLRWSLQTETELVVGLQSNAQAAMFHAPEGLLGEFNVQIAVEDPEGNKATDDLSVHVVEKRSESFPPVIAVLPIVQIIQGGRQEIPLGTYVSDADTPLTQLAWEIAPEDEQLEAVFDSTTLELILTPEPNFLGETTIALTVTDPEEHTAEATMQVSVIDPSSVDPTPVLAELPEVRLIAGSMDASIDLDDYVQDMDTPKGNLRWEIVESGMMEAFIDPDSHRLILRAPSDASGDTEVTVRVADPEGNEATRKVGTHIEAPNSSEPNEPQDRTPPTFNSAVFQHPILPENYQILLWSGEPLQTEPVLTVLLDGTKQGVDLESTGQLEWRGLYSPPPGVSGQATLRVLGVDIAGNVTTDGTKQFRVTASAHPPSYLRLVSYPNPATTITTFLCETDADVSLQMRIFNLKGQCVAEIPTLHFQRTEAGYQYEWDLRDQVGQRLSPGLYLASLQATYRDNPAYQASWRLLIRP